jgi:nicotinate phosphoribosyltransferase
VTWDRDLVEGALFTDQYQLAMAQVYFRHGMHERRALFDYGFRRYPDYGRHQAGYCVFAGGAHLMRWIAETRFTDDDLARLRSQTTTTGSPRFDENFLGWLRDGDGFASVTVTGVPEGRIVHPYAPVMVVEGPLAIAQILETSLLAHVNYPTLIATKASRVAESARGGSVLEFGTRRGPGFAGNVGARAAIIGGVDATSNVGVSHALGRDPKGTHAHSMVQAFMADGGSEIDAFRAFASVYPDDCVLLVDTVDTLDSGVPNAIAVFAELRAKGHEPRGIRLDSGDLAYLSIQAARQLDAAGFTAASIVLSSNLDELAIWQILAQIEDEAPRYGVDPADLTRRLVYGVGTRLITSHGHAALDGVYKLVALAGDDGGWLPVIKISESREKIPIPGAKRLWRIADRRGYATADVVAGPAEDLDGVDLELHHPYLPGTSRLLPAEAVADVEPLHVPLFADGGSVLADDLAAARERRTGDLERLDPGVRRLVNPHIYHVSLTAEIKRLKETLIASTRVD